MNDQLMKDQMFERGVYNEVERTETVCRVCGSSKELGTLRCWPCWREGK